MRMVRAALIQFLQQELAIPTESIAMVRRSQDYTPNLLPMLLWMHGMVTTEQLDQIFAWLETV